MRNISIKICGLTQEKDVSAAVKLGADFIGFVLEKSSKRHVSIHRLKQLLKKVPSSTRTVALLVNPLDSILEKLVNEVKIDFIQLHGQETPKRVLEIYRNNKLPIIKAIGVRRKRDLEKVKDYDKKVKYILLDAKPEFKESLPGGNGISFDWRILKDFHLKTKTLLYVLLETEITCFTLTAIF